MTKEQVVQFRDVIAKDKILQVVCDNQHIFYDRVAQKCPIMWDDDNEVFTVCRVNQDPNMQKVFPIETVQTSFSPPPLPADAAPGYTPFHPAV